MTKAGADQILDERKVNALIPDAEMRASLVRATAMSSDVIGGRRVMEGVISTFKKAQGGLWVGGKALLFADRFEFRPNMVNKIVHKKAAGRCIPLENVEEVNFRRATVTNIIDIVSDPVDLSLSVRCFGARKFADAIRNAALAGKT